MWSTGRKSITPKLINYYSVKLYLVLRSMESSDARQSPETLLHGGASPSPNMFMDPLTPKMMQFKTVGREYLP